MVGLPVYWYRFSVLVSGACVIGIRHILSMYNTNLRFLTYILAIKQVVVSEIQTVYCCYRVTQIKIPRRKFAKFWQSLLKYDSFALPKVVWSQYTDEVGKYITLWCQISWGYHIPNIIVIFWTTAKILQFYCRGILIWTILYSLKGENCN